MTLDRVTIPALIYRLPIQGLYEVSVLALIYNFNSKGFRLSNGKTAELLSVHKRTIERAISNLKKQGYIRDIGTGKNDRCLVINTDKMTVSDTDSLPVKADTLSAEIPTETGADTDILADHKEERILYTYTLRDNSHWNITQEKVSEYERTFADIDVHRELQKAAQWTIDNPTKRKTANGMPAFLSSWLGRVKPTPEPELPEADTDAILAKMGYTPEQIDELKAQGLTA